MLTAGADEDSVNVVLFSANCSTAAAGTGGTTDMMNLGPGDGNGLLSVTAGLNFTSVGTHKVCYKLAGDSDYTEVGSTLTVVSVFPTGFCTNGAVSTGSAVILTLTGGSGLHLGDGEDNAKVVASTGQCATNSAAGGNPEVTNLGADESDVAASFVQAHNVTTAFTFTNAGSYKMCYKLTDGSYAQVGTHQGSGLRRGLGNTGKTCRYL